MGGTLGDLLSRGTSSQLYRLAPRPTQGSLTTTHSASPSKSTGRTVLILTDTVMIPGWVQPAVQIRRKGQLRGPSRKVRFLRPGGKTSSSQLLSRSQRGIPCRG